MTFNSKFVDRSAFHSVKFDLLSFIFGECAASADTLSLWVADADWSTAPVVLQAVRQLATANDAVLGYTMLGDYARSWQRFLHQRFSFQIEQNWVLNATGVMPAMALAVNAFTRRGDCIAIFQPVYYPFRALVLNSARRLCAIELAKLDDGSYDFAFDEIERRFESERPRMLLLCSPNNPTGTVFARRSLAKLSALCVRFGVLVVADEVWAPLTLPGQTFVPFASVSAAARNSSVNLISCSKAFNMAGLQEAAVIIANAAVRAQWKRAFAAAGLFGGNCFGARATVAALSERGVAWLDQELQQIQANIDLLRTTLLQEHPEYGITPNRPQAGYLVWLDCTKLVERLQNETEWRNGIIMPEEEEEQEEEEEEMKESSDLKLFFDRIKERDNQPSEKIAVLKQPSSKLLHLFCEKLHVALDDGIWFGPSGTNFLRINVATPTKIVEDFLQRLSKLA